MSIADRYAVLFQPVRIGPAVARNRFFQVPHCTGMGWQRPETVAAMRATKAEGGWAVVCTEYNSIHPTSDDMPHIYARMWDDGDVRAHRLMTEQVHAHGALAGTELWMGGGRVGNLDTRLPALDVACVPNTAGHPFYARAMDKSDIRDVRRWHRDAALRAKEAGYDVVYVYATHGYLLANFLNPRLNTRSDEYGGSLENRTRLVREIIEDTKDAIGQSCAVAVRFAADERYDVDGVPIQGERRDMLELMAELPDLWDINIADYSYEMGVSRFVKEGALEPYMSFVKSVTSKPVVTVGRFTSPDTMVSQIRRGITDFIGAARPSIADPFLPRKIEEGRVEEIRECIGCNVCYSGDSLSVPIRCTQNPTMGEEWRQKWHPERVPAKSSEKRILIVGGGPAGLEAARVIGLRGYPTMLAEAGRVLGGRVTREARLPGMGEYIRVRDYREQLLRQMPNVDVFLESMMTVDDILAVEPDHVLLATGASWRKDVFLDDRYVDLAQPGISVLTPDDIMDGTLPTGPTVVFDNEGYYLGGVIAEHIAKMGVPVTLVAPADTISAWTANTGESWRIRTHLAKLGIKTIPSHVVTQFDGQSVEIACVYSGTETQLPANSLVVVGQRSPRDELYRQLTARREALGSLPFDVRRIGDCEAPALIAAAVYAGHRSAYLIDGDAKADVQLVQERPWR